MNSKPEPDMEELERLARASFHSVLSAGILTLVLLLVFLGYFIAWLLAIRQRRRVGKQRLQ